jgi:hypothetical protein
MDNLYIIAGIFGAAALVGIYLLTLVLTRKETPKAITITHGIFAATALILLLVYVLDHKPAPIESLVLFVLAAAGGFVLVFKDFTGRKIPRWLAVAHGLLAVTGFVFLICFIVVTSSI